FLFAQVEFGIGVDFIPYPAERAEKAKKVPELKNDFIEKISIRFNQNYDKLYLLYRRGYGYTELIKLLLITEKSGKALDEIVKIREKKEKISKIATSLGLDYKEIYFESYKIKTELESSTTEQYTHPKDIQSKED
ncbi:MAG: hypothetical protein QME68_05610, partial [Elusimicrobiota bacterium]|nr:hypothetical protein [Elusimicrobiota bacterium]